MRPVGSRAWRQAMKVGVRGAALPQDRQGFGSVAGAWSGEREVAARGRPCVRRGAYWNRLTTRAMIRPTIANEISACEPIAILAHGTMGIVSVGLNALAVVNPTYR